ncbi:MAG: glycoside hydrolase family 9 protein, partial [Ruminococcus sp.]|nr:glycoside hydrolase family 9 protein [Ruminococcus sp.]
MQKKHRITSAAASAVLAAASAVLAAASLTSVFTAPAALADDVSQYDNYAKLLQYSLYFYDTNMCGDDVSENSAISWRDDCHTSDEVQGGFHDAGDHVMFGLPQGFTASTIGWSYYEFPEAYDATGQGEHLQNLTDRFCEFFKNSTIRDGNGDVSRFLYQKGDGNEDHAYWGAPERQNGSRRMYWTSDSASDIAAEYAAALAVNYINFGNPEDLDYAESLYRFSVKYNSVAGEGTYGFYNNSGCRDEQAWAAGWLYKATGNDYYLNECASKQNPYVGWVHGWENVDLGSACICAEITGDWSNVNNYIRNKATGNGY